MEGVESTAAVAGLIHPATIGQEESKPDKKRKKHDGETLEERAERKRRKKEKKEKKEKRKSGTEAAKEDEGSD